MPLFGHAPEVADANVSLPAPAAPSAPHAAYQDCPQPLGYGATISAPHMHAACLELLAGQLRPGNRVRVWAGA